MLAFQRLISLLTFVVFIDSSDGSLLNKTAALIGHGAGLLTADKPLLPSVDPFYQPPSGFEDEAPGTILRSRKISAAYFGLIHSPVHAWQLLYRTTAINGSAIATATTIFKGENAKTDRFVSFHTAYDGASRTGSCDPSYNYQFLAKQYDLISSVEMLALRAFVHDGNIVSSPDYEGPDAAFGAGRLAGTGVLDSMRAVANFKDTLGFDTDHPAVVGYGYSGGGIATSWAASLQPTYAPEIAIKGWASGGTPANLTGTAVFFDGTLFVGFLPQAIVGLTAPSAWGAELQPILDRVITANGTAVLEQSKRICGVENLFTVPFQQIQSTKFQSLGKDIFYEPTIAKVLEQCTMGQNKTETPKAPVYMYHAPHDEVIPYLNATTLRDDWCNDGASVHFVNVANGGHATTELIGFPGAFNFVKKAFAGSAGNGCSEETILDEKLNLVALGVSLEPIGVGMANALAIAGRKDKNIIEDPSNLNKTVDVPGPGVVNATVVDPKIYKTATDEMDTDDTDTDLDDDETDTDLDTDETDI
jgi:pimeloyl-ACP methyl ester carboxylesterase